MIRKSKALDTLILAATLTLMLVSAGCGSGGGGITDYTGDGTSAADTVLNAKLTWDPPTTNEDGTPLTDLAGYKLYYGPSSANYTGSIDVEDTTSVEIGAIVDVLYDSLPTTDTVCFAVTAYDTYGNESDYSNEVCENIL